MLDYSRLFKGISESLSKLIVLTALACGVVIIALYFLAPDLLWKLLESMNIPCGSACK